MRKYADRCDHCGKWVAECQGFTLYDMANGHRESESVHVCKKCSGSMVKGEWKQTYSPEYWSAWLDKRFPSDAQVQS
jgi:hypothetical protein